MKFGTAQAPTAGNPRRAVSGVLLLDKPGGITSQAAVSKAKRLFAAVKAGHTGTLDPMATGLLPICFGEATKFSRVLLDADKTYTGTVKLGITTTTGDLEGEVTATAPVAVERSVVEAVLGRFRGEILQTPPMFSAIKHAGRPLYKYARAGLEVARAPRRVHIRAIELTGFTPDELWITVTCGKGAYVRVLAEDVGRALGCGACLAALRRTAVGNFGIDAAITLGSLCDLAADQRGRCLSPVDSLVATLPRVDLDASQAREIATGRPVQGLFTVSCGLVGIYGPSDAYLGIGTVPMPGTVVPRRLMAAGMGA